MTSINNQTELRKLIDNPIAQHPIHDFSADPYYLSRSILRELLFENGDLNALDLSYYNDAYAPLASQIPRLASMLADHLNAIFADEFSRNLQTTLYLEFSVCPVHICDYQNCFETDDETEAAECAQIREYFPSHDS